MGDRQTMESRTEAMSVMQVDSTVIIYKEQNTCST